MMDIIGVVLTAFGFNFEAQISLRDPNDHTKYVGTDEDWALAEKAIVEACQEKGLNAKVEYGEAAFYGPDRKSTRLNSSHNVASRMPSSA